MGGVSSLPLSVLLSFLFAAIITGFSQRWDTWFLCAFSYSLSLSFSLSLFLSFSLSLFLSFSLSLSLSFLWRMDVSLSSAPPHSADVSNAEHETHTAYVSENKHNQERLQFLKTHATKSLILAKSVIATAKAKLQRVSTCLGDDNDSVLRTGRVRKYCGRLWLIELQERGVICSEIPP